MRASRRAPDDRVRKRRAGARVGAHTADVSDEEALLLDRAVCYRALTTRDSRFDGRFFTAVLTTGIYCRPICPARCPKLENVVFYVTAAAAQEAGFRPCLRCRPESSPHFAAWRGTSTTVSRALGMIGDGALDGDASVESLAVRLGIGERQLRRLFDKHLGASPIAVAQTRRVHFAKQLIHETRLSMTDVAMAAGFGSVRRFNESFRRMYGRSPSALRNPRGAAGVSTPSAAGVDLVLSYAGAYDWDAMVEFFAGRAITGVELVEPRRYRRTIALAGSHGTLDVSPIPGKRALRAIIRFGSIKALPTVVARVRRMFDLGADTQNITHQLGRDRALAPLVRRRPGLRVPGAWDGFELAVRAVLGQQITVAGARKLAAKLVAVHGEPLAPSAAGIAPERAMVFPSPDRLAAVDLAPLGMPRARANALSSLARAARDTPTLFERALDASLDETIQRLTQLPGIGEWTAHYVALRALHDPDAFPAGDVALQRALAEPGGARPSAAQLLARAEAWRPWRAYAAQHLWASDSQPAGATNGARSTR